MAETTANMPREKIITLARPIEHGGGTIAEIKLQPPTVAQYRRAMQSPNPVDQTINLVALVSGITREALDKMDVDELLEANSYIMGFIEPGRRTGES